MTLPAPATGHEFASARDLPTPALVFYPDRIVENLRRMLRATGSPTRLRPHVKTHKSPDVVALHQDLGITKFKCATLAEAEMLAACRAPDVLFALQPVGPNVGQLVALARKFPDTVFSTVADNVSTVRETAAEAAAAGTTIGLWLDVDCGMHRTGVAPRDALPVYRAIASTPGVAPRGLHAYDGHLNDTDPSTRQTRCDAAWSSVESLRLALLGAGLPVPAIVAGGTPTFPFHAGRPGVECSPGTCVLWDAGYSTRLPDLDFLHAAFLLTRLVSKPSPQHACFDLGHKAVASENPLPNRVRFVGLGDPTPLAHSEEHLVVQLPSNCADLDIGALAYAIPWHICPTVALHDHATIVRHGQALTTWPIRARTRATTP